MADDDQGHCYEIVITTRGQRAYDSLPRDVQDRFDKKLALLSQTPRPPGTRPLKGHPGALRLRVGQYRMFFAVNDDIQQVKVHYFGHRRDVYDRFIGL